jgi:PAS domain S-box-containing protein
MLVMNLETFSQRIKASRLKSNDIYARAHHPPSFKQEVLEEAVEELQVTLEELRVAEDELRLQNEQLAILNQALGLERQQYEELFEFAPDAYLVTDESGIIYDANIAAAELFDTSKKFLRGKPLIFFVDKQEHNNFFLELRRFSHLYSERRISFETRLQRRNKQSFFAAVTVGFIQSGQDNLAGLRWMIRDITDRKRAEEVICSLKEKLGKQVAERSIESETASRETVSRETASREAARLTESHKPRPPVDNQLLAAFSPEDYERILPSLELVSLVQGEFLYRPEDKIEYVYFPTSGVVSLVSVTEEGDTIEVGMVGNDGALGMPLFLGTDIMPYLVIVQIPGAALRMRREIFEIESGRQEQFQRSLLRYTQVMLAMLTQSAVCNRFHTLDERLCRWLLTIQDFVKTSEFMLTQEFISQMLGVRRSGVTVAACELQDGGLIKYSRGKISIISREGLESKACECYRIVRSTSISAKALADLATD